MVVMCVVLLASVLMRYTNVITGSELVELLKVTVLAFFASNSAEHLRNILNK